MTDIDFDELDKAVNSLMGNVGGEPAKKRDDQRTLTIKSTLKEDEAPSYDKIDTAARKIGSETLTVPDADDDDMPALTLDSSRYEVSAAEIDRAASRISGASEGGSAVQSTQVPVGNTPAKAPAPELEVSAVAPPPILPPEPVEEVEAPEARQMTETVAQTVREELADVSPAPAPGVLATTKPKGRFMDVVHPSSDMKTAAMLPGERGTQPEESPVPIGRTEAPSLVVAERGARPEGAALTEEAAVPSKPTLQPVLGAQPTKSAPLMPLRPVAAPEQFEDVDAPTSVAPSVSTVEVAVSEAAPIFTSDDNEVRPEVALEYDISAQTVGDVVGDPEERAAHEQLDASTLAQLQNELSNSAEQGVGAAQHGPLETPFVPDVKVHKRPLGAPVSGARSGALLMEVHGENGTARPSDAQSIPDVMLSATETEMMHDELAALEAQPVAGASYKTDIVSAQSAAVSEPQAPAATEDADGSLFDTTEYHAPIAHPEKRTSGWVWIVVTIVLVLSSAAAAAYLYLTLS